ncbi:MAG: class I SAM-dependent methyltransferase [Gammaproteobacteria bacterium]|nr:class I SAM-dependent methyltransferase [Gammaproteobacteria bacterium]
MAETYAKSPVADGATYQRKLTETQSLLRPSMHVLEFGCGTGTTAIHHAPHVRQIHAIDISEKMLDIARRRSRDAGVDNIHFAHGTLPNPDVGSESFDAVLGLNVIHLMPNWRDVLTDVERILKPGGVFVSSTECLGHSFRRFAKLVTPLGSRLGVMPDIAVMTEAELGSAISSAGLEIERQWRHARHGTTVFTIATKSSEARGKSGN